MALAERLPPEEVRRILDDLEAKYADDIPGPDPRATRWVNLGAEEPDPDPLPVNDAGMTALVKFFALLEQERPAWQRDALCLEYPDVSFFPERGESSQAAKDVCARCSCKYECRLWAVETDARDGIWAGESARTLRR